MADVPVKAGRSVANVVRVVLPAWSLAWSVGCGGSDTDGPTNPPPRGVTVGSVVIAPGLVARGGAIPRTATVMDLSGSEVTNIARSWQSESPGVATVSPAGIVTGVAAGTATITATAGGVSGSAIVTVANLSFSDIDVGSRHACALTAAGETYCWGDNTRGAVSARSIETCAPGECVTTPGASAGWPALSRLALGNDHSCALAPDGTARCWGSNVSAQLGSTANGSCVLLDGRSISCSRTPVPVSGGRVFTALSAGGSHSCGLLASGAAWCWGRGAEGQLGVPTSDNVTEPQEVTGGHRFSSISAGFSHTCGIAVGGSVWCWGDNQWSQLGSAGSGTATPVEVPGTHGFTRISAGASHTCGIDAAGKAWCWGLNSYGQLGNGSTSDAGTPIAVLGDLTFSSISVGAEHTCALTVAGAAYCWGHNTFGSGLGQTVGGQLGDGTLIDRLVPTRVAGDRVFVQLATRRATTCGRTASGATYCWGDGRFGQLGDGDFRRAIGSTPYRSSPTGVAGIP